MDDLIAEFLTETNESLGDLDQSLIVLEQNPNDKDLLSRIFRLMHTIKGTCGFLGLPRLETLAHKAEDVLGQFRDGVLTVTPECVTLILESIDRIKFIVRGLEEKGAEPEGRDEDLIARLLAVRDGKQTPALVQTASAPPPSGAHDEFEPKESAVAAQSLRVSVDVLENLMTMVSELVLTRNQLLQISRTSGDSGFTAPLQQLNHVVSELQDGVMKTRMQPIGNAWAKLPRIVRDISIELGKKIELDMRGQDTELDRQVLEMIKDPLTHMVRNSADHGIETPAQRLAAGKPETGRIRLNSCHEGGHILIEISDDGRGLSTERIRQKVLDKGLATEEDLKAMTPQQIQQFIFGAGFSTAEKVTAVSGRGVGMDVVRTNIEKIGGSIELKSVEGKGTDFIIKIPLTLAIVSALIVESGGERFAIPQLAVRELVLAQAGGDHRIETIKNAPVFRLRNRLLPLISLSAMLNLEQRENKAGHSYIVVTETGDSHFGIIVDRVFDTEEIVIKQMARILKGNDLFSGNTILGDGSVIMILDPGSIAKKIGKTSTATEEDAAAAEKARKVRDKARTALLLFHAAGSPTPRAVPLELVSRLEQVETRSIETADGRMVIQYRGQLMPLLTFGPSGQQTERKNRPVLVFSDRERVMGLIVDSIIDIAEDHVEMQASGHGEIVGSAIINGHATDLVDVAYFLRQVNTAWFKNHGDEPFAEGHNAANGSAAGKRILLVEDSPFFRNMLAPLLSVAGYEVTSLSGPTEALTLCESGEEFDIILSDIEMPDMNGFEFARKVRDETSWKNVPMVALSSHTTPQDMERGKEAGFDRYIAKFDRETLLDTLSQTIAGEACRMKNAAVKIQDKMQDTGDFRDFLTVSIAGQIFGIPVLQVQDVLGSQRVTRIPLAPPAVAGSLNLRGRIVTAIDVRRSLNLGDRPEKAKAMSVVVEHEGELYSLIIDSVGDVLSLGSNAFEANPATLDPVWQHISAGIYRLDGKLLVVLDVPALLGAIRS